MVHRIWACLSVQFLPQQAWLDFCTGYSRDPTPLPQQRKILARRQEKIEGTWRNDPEEYFFRNPLPTRIATRSVSPAKGSEPECKFRCNFGVRLTPNETEWAETADIENEQHTGKLSIS